MCLALSRVPLAVVSQAADWLRLVIAAGSPFYESCLYETFHHCWNEYRVDSGEHVSWAKFVHDVDGVLRLTVWALVTKRVYLRQRGLVIRHEFIFKRRGQHCIRCGEGWKPSADQQWCAGGVVPVVRLYIHLDNLAERIGAVESEVYGELTPLGYLKLLDRPDLSLRVFEQLSPRLRC